MGVWRKGKARHQHMLCLVKTPPNGFFRFVWFTGLYVIYKQPCISSTIISH